MIALYVRRDPALMYKLYSYCLFKMCVLLSFQNVSITIHSMCVYQYPFNMCITINLKCVYYCPFKTFALLSIQNTALLSI